MKINRNIILFVLGIILVGYFIYDKWITPNSQQSERKVIEVMVEKVLKDDVLFYAEIAPAFCEKNGSLSFLFFTNPSKSEIRRNRKEIVRILNDAEIRLKSIAPTDNFHKRLKDNFLLAFTNISENKLLSKDADKSQEEFSKLFKQFELAFWKSGAEPYYVKKMANFFEAIESHLSMKEKFFMKFYETDKDFIAEELMKNIQEISMQNSSYKKYYDNGCLELLSFELSNFIKKPKKEYDIILEKAVLEYKKNDKSQ